MKLRQGLAVVALSVIACSATAHTMYLCTSADGAKSFTDDPAGKQCKLLDSPAEVEIGMSRERVVELKGQPERRTYVKTRKGKIETLFYPFGLVVTLEGGVVEKVEQR